MRLMPCGIAINFLIYSAYRAVMHHAQHSSTGLGQVGDMFNKLCTLCKDLNNIQACGKRGTWTPVRTLIKPNG